MSEHKVGVIDEEPERVIEADAGSVAPATKRSRLYFRRFVRNKPAVFGFFLFVLLVLFAIFGPYIARFNYLTIDWSALTQPPNAVHWFGTNQQGQDLFAELAHGLRRSLVISLFVSFFSTIFAAIIGALAAYLGGRWESIIMAIINFMLILPAFLLQAVIALWSGGNWIWLIVVLSAFSWMMLARMIWQLSTSIRERAFVSAAKYMGVSNWQAVIRHMVPNIGSLLIVEFTLSIVSAVNNETALSFLGFGIKIPDVSLGSLLQGGSTAMQMAPWLLWFPAGALFLYTISVALMGNGLRDALDPNSAAGGKA
jgi:peptide/nickel transport system permease protein